MSRRVKWSPAAKQDLKDLKKYISSKNRLAADRFARAAKAAGQKLAEFPEMAPIWETTHPLFQDLRVWPIPQFENHLIFYRRTPQGIEIAGVIHGSRDIGRFFGR
jgi:plasmid stabilization system protein ParE